MPFNPVTAFSIDNLTNEKRPLEKTKGILISANTVQQSKENSGVNLACSSAASDPFAFFD